jgi:hypothetical protein
MGKRSKRRTRHLKFCTAASLVSAILFITFDNVSMSFDRRSIAICSRSDVISDISFIEWRFALRSSRMARNRSSVTIGWSLRSTGTICTPPDVGVGHREGRIVMGALAPGTVGGEHDAAALQGAGGRCHDITAHGRDETTEPLLGGSCRSNLGHHHPEVLIRFFRRLHHRNQHRGLDIGRRLPEKLAQCSRLLTALSIGCRWTIAAWHSGFVRSFADSLVRRVKPMVTG